MAFSLSLLSSENSSTLLDNCIAIHADCFDFLKKIPDAAFHAVVTDPPYGVKEYETEQLFKKDQGIGGVWRIPPSFDGHQRSPLPRFTALNDKEITNLKAFLKSGLAKFFVFWFLVLICLSRVIPFYLSRFLPLSLNLVLSFVVRLFGQSAHFAEGTDPKMQKKNFHLYLAFHEAVTNPGDCFVSQCSKE